jgi:hypothetical protein
LPNSKTYNISFPYTAPQAAAASHSQPKQTCPKSIWDWNSPSKDDTPKNTAKVTLKDTLKRNRKLLCKKTSPRKNASVQSRAKWLKTTKGENTREKSTRKKTIEKNTPSTVKKTTEENTPSTTKKTIEENTPLNHKEDRRGEHPQEVNHIEDHQGEHPQKVNHKEDHRG